ncbi:MAG TPA: phytanoyl-CoA dioxygenase family protein [Chthonomonadales bacterium]|nr:phytanoyl-CoA dioxygenase family protein [Chthonomonadales bacterium]
MTTATLPADTMRREFEEKGYIILKSFFEPEVIEGAKHELSKLVDRHAEKLLSEGRINNLMQDEPFEMRFAKLYAQNLDIAPKSFRTELHLPGLFYVFFHPRLLDVVELFLGGEIRLYPNYTARPKLPEWAGTEVLWHQDGGYTAQIGTHEGSVEALHMVNVWTPLVPARVENGCMEFIPGTHKLGIVPHEGREYYLEIASEYLQPHLSQAVPIETDPGDVVLFHNLLFHHGLPNRSKAIRWSIDWRYQDATQSTMRTHQGHIARSRSHPEQAVKSAEEWASLSFV